MTTGRALSIAGVMALCGSGALSGLLEVLLVPLRSGRTLVPIAVLFAVAGNIALPRLARTLVPTTGATLAPFLSWLFVVVVLGLFPRPEGDVILPGGGHEQLVSYGVLLGGAVAGTVTVVLSTPMANRGPARVSR